MQHELGNGLRVEKLQFGVRRTWQAQREFPAPPIIDAEPMNKMIKFGGSQDDASDLGDQYIDDILRTAIAGVPQQAL